MLYLVAASWKVFNLILLSVRNRIGTECRHVHSNVWLTALLKAQSANFSLKEFGRGPQIIHGEKDAQ